jgi:hypothetical protein
MNEFHIFNPLSPKPFMTWKKEKAYGIIAYNKRHECEMIGFGAFSPTCQKIYKVKIDTNI